MTSNVDIYYVTASYPYGSGESFIEPEIGEWEQRGRVVRVIPVYARGALRTNAGGVSALTHYPLFRFNYILSGIFWTARAPRKVGALVLDLLRAPGKLPKNLAALFKAFALADSIKAAPALHVHAHWGGVSSTMAMAISRLTGIPWSLTCHRWDIYENNLLALKSRDAQFVRFISDRGMRDSLRYGVRQEKALVVHMGVNLTSMPPQKTSPSTCPRIVCAANLIEVKGHRYLIEAMRLIKDKGIDATLYLYGDGPLRDSLMQQCRELKLGESVVFAGQLPHLELLDTYKAGKVDLFVLPSIQVSDSHHEGIPVSLMEAMSFGIPVVSTQTGSIEELLPAELGVTVPDRSASALADVMYDVLGNPAQYAGLSKALGELVVNGWQIKSCIDALERCILQGGTCNGVQRAATQ